MALHQQQGMALNLQQGVPGNQVQGVLVQQQQGVKGMPLKTEQARKSGSNYRVCNFFIDILNLI